MLKDKVKKATPIAVTLLIALTPQALAFCDNRAKAYETRKAAKEARLEATFNGSKADSGYKTLLPAIEELQKHRLQDQAFMLEESVRVTELTRQVEELRLLIPKRNRPAPLRTLTKPHVSKKPSPAPSVKLPEDLTAAHAQEQKALVDDFLMKRAH